MRHFNRTKNRNCRQLRKLRVEPLEHRRLLAAASMGFDDAAIAPDAVEPAYAEISQFKIEQKDAILELDRDALDRIYSKAQALTPLDAIHVPETIDMPTFDRFGPDVDEIPDELGMKYGLPPEIDPSKLPGTGCPDGQPPQDDEAFSEWNWAETMSDISTYLEAWDDATVDKVAEATGSGFVRPRPFGSGNSDGGKGAGGKDTGGKDTSDGAVNDEEGQLEEEPATDDSPSQPPVTKDPEPEGDDPDEFRGELVDQVMTHWARSTTSPTGQSKSGLPSDSTEEDGEGLGFRLRLDSRPDPEDGGPDELLSPTAAFAFGRSAASSDYGYPTPDDPEGPPPGPEFSPPELASRTSQELNLSEMPNGKASYTTPDDLVGPPRPEV